MNKAIIVGNVGKDAEVRTFDNGGKIATFTVATSKHWKDKQGEKKEKTSWHNIQISIPSLLDIVEKYVKKGMKVAIEGEIDYHVIGEGETKKTYTNINADKVEFLSKSESQTNSFETDEAPF